MMPLCRLACVIALALIISPALGYGQSPEADMVHRLELALGRPFATSQRLDLETAAHTALEKLRPDRDDFIRSVSRITGMPSQEISAVMASTPEGAGPLPSVIPLLEAKKHSPFTAPQKDELMKAEEHYKTAAYPQVEGFVREAAFILGLDPQDIRPWIPRMGF